LNGVTPRFPRATQSRERNIISLLTWRGLPTWTNHHSIRRVSFLDTSGIELGAPAAHQSNRPKLQILLQVTMCNGYTHAESASRTIQGRCKQLDTPRLQPKLHKDVSHSIPSRGLARDTFYLQLGSNAGLTSVSAQVLSCTPPAASFECLPSTASIPRSFLSLSENSSVLAAGSAYGKS
jgi:hypothetical protein